MKSKSAAHAIPFDEAFTHSSSEPEKPRPVSEAMREVETRKCAGHCCETRFSPNRPEQQFCGRKCSFKALRYSRYRSRWHEAVEQYGYVPKYGRDDDDD